MSVSRPKTTILIVAVLLLLPSLSHAGRHVRVGVYQNRPGVFVDGDGRAKGFYMDLLEETATQKGWQLEPVLGTWAEGLLRLEQAAIDILVAIAYTTERAEKFAFNRETVFSNWGQVYVRDLQIQSILDLENRKIAGLGRDVYTSQFEALLNGFNIHHQLIETTEYGDVLRKVATGVADAGIVSRSNGIVSEKNYAVFRSSIVCCPMEIHYATLKGSNQDLLVALDHRLGQLKKDKESLYYQSMENWFSGTAKKAMPVWLVWAGGLVMGMVVLLASGVIVLRQQRRRIEEKLEAAYNERRAMEIKLLSSSKLATIGEVATGVAHELNQPLTYISTFTQNLEVALQNDTLDIARIKKRIGTVNEQFQRIDEIIRHLQTFGRKDETIGAEGMQWLPLAEVVDKPLMFLGERMRLRGIVFERRIAEGVPPIFGHMNRLEQVFINLFQNAIYALAKQNDAKIIVTINYLAASKQVEVQFTDNGMGMTAAVKDKIFEPFFTTKAVGEGTGLGLAIVYGIVQEHSGTITCISEPGQGATFILHFPAGGL